jgi:amino acid transporter
LIGLLFVAAGTVLSATIVSGYVGYLREFIDITDWPAILLTLIGLGCIAVWGITQSVTIAAIGPLIEISGLLLMIWGGQSQLVEVPDRLPELMLLFETDAWLGIVVGGVLAFYAFLGFEDIVNVVEETREPERSLP